MNEHRLISTDEITVVSFDPPFSSFEYVESNYEQVTPAIRRLFSLARSHSAHTLMVENLQPVGIISDENDEIKQYIPDYEMTGLERVSFWRSSFSTPDESVCRDEDCIGYAILKCDRAISRNCRNKWHVFEAVFEKYQDKHNCVPNPMQYTVTLGKQNICISGLLYAQQNALNKSCAQVALRSLISRIKGDSISYSQINDLARQVSASDFYPGDGLGTPQIRAVLEGYGMRFRDFDYTQYGENERATHPYQKYVYSGIESGAGALVGFKLTGPGIQENTSHIIPFYGHTFNKDTWAPEAEIAYFRVGESLGYLPSENWTSSFLGHDDNFGPNFCVPRLYIRNREVDYVVELLKPGIVFGGAQAEALALQFLYSALVQIDASANTWLRRLVFYADPTIQRIILRAIAIERETYISHLSEGRDWDQNCESKELINVLTKLLPRHLWVVEVSIPQLFPANERKLGDILLNGEVELSSSQSGQSNFIFVRLPGLYLFELRDRKGNQDFLSVPSNIKSHLAVITL